MGKIKGTALLTALFIMTLVAIVVTAMTSRLSIDIYKTTNFVEGDKLFYASQIVTFWGMDFLSQPIKSPLAEINDFPEDLMNYYPGIIVTGKLYDLQARFNVNNLLDKHYFLSFQQLLEKVSPSINEKQRATLALALDNWISAYNPTRGFDPFTQLYRQKKLPYLPAHMPMRSISEFRLVHNVTAEIYNKLSPFLIALPEKTAINLNTAKDEVLSTLANGLNRDEVIELRSSIKDGILNINDILPTLQKLNIPVDQITTISKYYLTEAYVKNPNLSLIQYTLLKRTEDKTRISVEIIFQSLNSF